MQWGSQLYKFGLVLFCLSLMFNQQSLAKDIVFPGHEVDYYVTSILKHALSYTPDKNYQVKFFNQDLPKTRVIQNIATNKGIDILAAGSTRERENQLLAIKFPILKGLHGWRIPLVALNRQTIFVDSLSLSMFKKLKPGQLHSWSDTKVLEANDIIVENCSNYEGLFQMLANNRFDYLPRSIIEIDQELENNKDLAIVIDQNILIHYPTAYYFYLNKDNQLLAKDIEFGLEQALADGSLDTMFAKYYGDFIDKVRQEKRKVYHLKNPTLPTNTPLARKELWLDLSSQ